MAAYDTRYTGEITITPPLSWAEIAGSPFVTERGDHPDRDCGIRVVEQPEQTPDGTLIRKQGVAVTATYGPGYELVRDLQELIDLHGEGHTFAGYIEADGADAGDLWRLAVIDGRATRVEPRIVWPELPLGGEA